jgi:AbrB family looped-hinge helix DNA binding protein
MTAHVTTVTRKGQVTIPVNIRRSLGLSEGDRVAVEQRDDAVVMRRSQSVTDRTAGILAQYRHGPVLTAEQERAAFEAAVAEEVAESMRQP